MLTRRVDAATSRIIEVFPEWEPLFRIPLVIQTVASTDIWGYSNLAYPQHVFLGQKTVEIEDDDVFLEQFLPEAAHNWLYFLQEISAFEKGADAKKFTLPSGTSGKSLTGLLDASFVMAVLLKYYSRVKNGAREAWLSAYLQGALTTVGEEDAYTAFGSQTRALLAEELLKYASQLN